MTYELVGITITDASGSIRLRENVLAYKKQYANGYSIDYGQGYTVYAGENFSMFIPHKDISMISLPVIKLSESWSEFEREPISSLYMMRDGTNVLMRRES